MVGKTLRGILPGVLYLTRKDCDLEDGAAVRRLFADLRPSAVVHLAALVGGIQDNVSRPWDYMIRNTLINAHVVQSAVETGVEYFLGLSSTCAYPGTVLEYPMTEDQLHLGPPAMENLPYGYSKRLLGVSLDAASRQCGLKSAVLYPCNLYGPHDSFDGHRSHLVAALIRKVWNARRDGLAELPMLGTGRPLRQFMLAGDLARAIAGFLEGRIPGHFNVATPENLTVDAIADTVQRVMGFNVPRRYSGDLDGQYRKDASSDRLLAVLPDFTFTPLAEGVKQTYEWYLQNS